MRLLISLISFLLFSSLLSAQENNALDTISPPPLVPADSLLTSTVIANPDQAPKKEKKKKGLKGFFTKDYPKPKRAMLLSFVIPGAGQAYNKKWWKVPIAMGGTTAMIFVVRNNTLIYRELDTEYRNRVDGDGDTVPDPKYARWADADILNERNRWRKWREMSYMGIALVQLLGGIDAFVDAHMHGLEINENLSLKLKPSFENTALSPGPVLGFGMSFQLHKPPTPQPKVFLGAGK